MRSSFLVRLASRCLVLAAAAIASGTGTAAAGAVVELPAEMRVKVKRLAKIVAKCDGPVKWLNLHEDLDLIPGENGKTAIVLGARPGRYKIAAYTADKDGPSDPAYCTVIVEDDAPPGPPPAPPPAPKPANPEAAIVRIRFGNAGCTATIIGPRRTDGRWNVLSAAHCISGVGAKGQMTLKDGRAFALTVSKVDRTADISWLLTDAAPEGLPTATIAAEAPAVGTKIWHMGYGVDRPGNRESGTINSAIDSHGQIKMRLSVSSGDSGGGIFREDNGELVACVCCTAGMARVADVWGGAGITATKILNGTNADLIHPITIHPIEMLPDQERMHAPILHLGGVGVHFQRKTGSDFFTSILSPF